MEHSLSLSLLIWFLPFHIFITFYSEIDQSSTEVTEDLEKSKDSALERKKTLEEQKEDFQRAAYAILNMLNNQESG